MKRANPIKKELQRKLLQLNIECLTGKAFQIIASPKETIMDIKEKIEAFEGISSLKQHLVWQSLELQDEKSLEDYKIEDGTTLRLIPAMRGGPINFRRVQVQEEIPPELLRLLADVEDESSSTKRPVAVVVLHNGEMLNFFRLLDADFSFDSMSVTSVFDVEEEDNEEAKKRKEEDERMRQNMQTLRKKMDTVAFEKPKVSILKSPPPPLLIKQHSFKNIPPISPLKLRATPVSHKNNPVPLATPVRATDIRLPPTIPNVSSKNKANVQWESTAKESSSHKSSYYRSVHRVPEHLSRFSMEGNYDRSFNAFSSSFSMHNPTSYGYSFSYPRVVTKQTNNSKVRRSSYPEKELKSKFDVVITNANKKEAVKPAGNVRLQTDSFGSISKSLKALSYLMGAGGGGSRYKMKSDLASKVQSGSRRSIKPIVPVSVQPAGSQKKVTGSRCAVCSKKTGLASTYECRCHKTFCTNHRNPEAHSCTYDYKSEGRKEIKENNPFIAAPKLPKI